MTKKYAGKLQTAFDGVIYMYFSIHCPIQRKGLTHFYAALFTMIGFKSSWLNKDTTTPLLVHTL